MNEWQGIWEENDGMTLPITFTSESDDPQELWERAYFAWLELNNDIPDNVTFDKYTGNEYTEVVTTFTTERTVTAQIKDLQGGIIFATAFFVKL